MRDEPREIKTDLAVIGTGLAGVAAAIFAHNRGIGVAQTGNTGALAYTTGYLDLYGFSTGGSVSVDDPWAAIAVLAEQQRHHPYARIDAETIRMAFEEFTEFLNNSGVRYTRPGDTNLDALTPIGTTKKTLCVPETMLNGVIARDQKKSCLIVDFNGLRGFSGRQIVANAGSDWPGLRSERIHFPGIKHRDLYPEMLARSLEVPGNREKLAAAIKAVLKDEEFVGMPAVLGMYRPDKVKDELQKLIGRTLFEIPTMPPAVPGVRLREMVEQTFPALGISFIPQQKILSASFGNDWADLALKDNFGEIIIKSRWVLMATGRFISGGLEADMDRIVEPLMNLHVAQPDSREEWYRHVYMDVRGHRINRAGIVVDECFRPLALDGRPVRKNLFAAGIMLAYQDWIRERCGAGIAIASAYRAIESVVEEKKRSTGATFS